MTLDEAEKIAKEYGAVLENEGKNPNDGPASYLSQLRHQSGRIIQAMKLWLAHDMQKGSLSQELQNIMGTAAGRLPFFIEDEEARRLNDIRNKFTAKNREGLSAEEFIARANRMEEVNEWTMTAHLAGMQIRSELADFIATVQNFNRADILYWQRVYTLAGVEYSAGLEHGIVKKSIPWGWLRSRDL